MSDYYLNKTAARIDQLLDKVETLENYDDSEIKAKLAEKADLSILTPMTQEQYDAIVTKTAPLYFIYEDGGNQ